MNNGKEKEIKKENPRIRSGANNREHILDADKPSRRNNNLDCCPCTVFQHHILGICLIGIIHEQRRAINP